MTMRLAQTMRRLVADCRGMAMVELGLVSPIFFILAVGVLEVGRFVYMQQGVIAAVHQGGRYAIVHGSKSAAPASTADIVTAVTNAAWFDAANINASVSFSPDNNPGSKVVITATYSWTSIAPLLDHLLTTTITAKSEMTILQ